jgi:hypothetical protein
VARASRIGWGDVFGQAVGWRRERTQLVAVISPSVCVGARLHKLDTADGD